MDKLIQTISIYAIPVLLAITLHEAAHGYTARFFGDNTAYVLGRITLNPIKHIDPVGTILMPLMLYFVTSGAFLFGYAKPVPVNFGKLENPKRNMIWVALAGPAANLVQAFIWACALIFLRGLDITEYFFLKMCEAGILVNLVMFAFNLFPLPPLDGGRIMVGLLPYRLAEPFSRIEPWGFYIVMGLVVSGIVADWWMRPLMSYMLSSLNVLLTPLIWIFR